MNGPALAFFLRAGDLARAAGLRAGEAARLGAGDLARAAGLRAGLAALFGAGDRLRRVATMVLVLPV